MKLTCEDFTPFVDAYIDDELDAIDRAEFEAHVERCDACRAAVELQVQISAEIRSQGEQVRAPERLRSNILAALEQEAAAQPAPAASPGTTLRRRGMMAAPIAAALLLTLLLPAFTIAPASSTQLPIVEQTVDWHRGDYPLEISGPDATYVSRWFLGKVDFPVRLPQFEDARLLGARIAHVQDRRAAYVLYEIDGARMSVMMFHGDGLEVPGDKVRTLAGRDIALMNTNGYEVAVMQNNGITYTLTTELDEERFLDVMAGALKK